jgi:hypothetical protein
MFRFLFETQSLECSEPLYREDVVTARGF